MDSKEAKKRIEKLKEKINQYRYSRLVLNKELVPPEVEDSLKKELFDLELRFPQFITPDSPTQRVGGEPLEKFKKVRHKTPMYSFFDAFDRQDMKNWLERLENYLGCKIESKSKEGFYCELKIDGLAIELIYKKGVLVRGATRGDGKVGEDITQNLRTIEAIPLKLGAPHKKAKVPDYLVVRGEVFMTKKEFERINEERKKAGQPLYANPRNVAAGSVRQLDPKITASRKLDSFAYDIAFGIKTKTHEEEHEILKGLGFKTNPHNRRANNLEEVFSFRDEWEKKRNDLPYEIDGIVVIVNDNKIFEEGGIVGKGPRAAIAFKFSPKETTTILEDVKWQVGRTGVLTPVAKLKPVEVGGVVISSATLHNPGQIKKLGLKIGDTVVVSRAGDVIPQITKVLQELRSGKEKEINVPKKCPIDGSKIIKEGAMYRCSNQNCGARNREHIYHFVSRPAFNIEGIGPKIIDRFLDEGLISNAADIFQLKKGDIEVLEGFGEKSADNIVKEVEKRKEITLPRFLYALGIIHIGEETAFLLAGEIEKIKKISKPLDVLEAAGYLSLDDLQNIKDIGPKVAKSVYDWFRNKRNIKFLKDLDSAGIRIVELGAKRSSRLKGMTFVITGTLSSMTREEAKSRIRSAGGNVSSSVSKKTDYLVVGENPGSKLEEAKKLGVKMLREKDFLKILAKR